MKRCWPFLVIILLAGAYVTQYLWQTRLSPKARRDAAATAVYTAYKESITAQEETMEADNAGGKTPLETIDLLIRALEERDLDRAVSYFELEDDPHSPNFGTRHVVEHALAGIAEQNGLPRLIAILREMHPAEHKTASTSTIDYIAAPAYQQAMTLEFNPKTRVWKVKSL